MSTASFHKDFEGHISIQRVLIAVDDFFRQYIHSLRNLVEGAYFLLEGDERCDAYVDRIMKFKRIFAEHVASICEEITNTMNSNKECTLIFYKLSCFIEVDGVLRCCFGNAELMNAEINRDEARVEYAVVCKPYSAVEAPTLEDTLYLLQSLFTYAHQTFSDFITSLSIHTDLISDEERDALMHKNEMFAAKGAELTVDSELVNKAYKLIEKHSDIEFQCLPFSITASSEKGGFIECLFEI